MTEVTLTDAASTDAAPADAVMQLIGGFQVSQAVYVAAKLDIPTLLSDGPATVGDLARRTGSHEHQLRRLLRTLASMGLFGLDADVVTLRPEGATLSRTAPGSLQALACMWMETHYAPFGELLHAVRTGEPAATHFFGEPFFDWLSREGPRTELFSKAMRDVTDTLRAGVFDGYDLPAGEIIADIGAADASMLVELIKNRPERLGIAFDLPSVQTDAAHNIATLGYQQRIQTVAGDFFDSVPAADIYLLSYILHDWDDASCLRILRRVASAGGPGARLLVIESIVPPGDEPHLSKMIDLTMLGMLTGQERSQPQYTALLHEAGIGIDRIVPTRTPFSIIEATIRQAPPGPAGHDGYHSAAMREDA